MCKQCYLHFDKFIADNKTIDINDKKSVHLLTFYFQFIAGNEFQTNHNPGVYASYYFDYLKKLFHVSVYQDIF